MDIYRGNTEEAWKQVLEGLLVLKYIRMSFSIDSKNGSEIVDFLDGVILFDSNPTEKEMFLYQQILRKRSNEVQFHSNPSGMLNAISKLGPRQVCQKQFKMNDIVWICKDCQKDETCVLCNVCFQGSNHEGHDVYFYHSAVGGCCDCGDPDAWAPCGFCPNHGNKTENAVLYIPENIRDVAGDVFQNIAQKFLVHCNEVAAVDATDAHLDVNASSYTLLLEYDEIHNTEDYTTQFVTELYELYQIELFLNHSFLTEGYAEVLSVPFADYMRIQEIHTHFVSRGFHMILLSNKDKQRSAAMVAAIDFMHDVAQTNDGFCQLVCNAFPVSLLVQVTRNCMRLNRALTKSLHNLLITLMASQSFKLVVAVAYTRAYGNMLSQFGEGRGISGNSIFNVAVQFLNRDWIVNELTFGHSYLSEAMSALSKMLRDARQGGEGFAHPVIAKRRYNPIVGDLKVVFSSVDISSRIFLSTCVNQLLELYAQLQLIHKQTRATDQHVTYEDKNWIHAFNLLLGVTSLFDYLFNWLAEESAAVSLQMSYHCIGGSGGTELVSREVCEQLRQLIDETNMMVSSSKCASDSSISTRSLITDAVINSSSSSKSASANGGFLGKLRGYFQSTPSSPAATNSNSSSSSKQADTSASESTHLGKYTRTITLISAGGLLQRMLRHCLDWQEEFFIGTRLETLPRLYGLGQKEYASIQLFESPLEHSFHLPLHRCLAKAIAEACKYAHLSDSLLQFRDLLGGMHRDKLHVIVDFPISTLLFGAQIRLGMWRRNGFSVQDQLLNYAETPFCRIYRDLDYILLQTCLAVYPAHYFLNQLFQRFGLVPLLTTHCLDEEGSTADSVYWTPLLDEALKVVINLVTEIPTPGVAKRDIDERLVPQLRRELIHKLVSAKTSITYSALRECIANIYDSLKAETDVIDRVIAQVADKHVGSGMHPPTYTLKRVLWSEYDPCFARLSGNVHQAVIEQRPKLTHNVPLVTAPLAAHPCYSRVRVGILSDETLLFVLRDTIIIAAAHRTTLSRYESVRRNWSMRCSESLYCTTLQLLTLVLHMQKDESAVLGPGEQQRLVSHFSAFLREELVESSETIMGCSLLDAIVDLYESAAAGTSSSETNNKHWLGWILDSLSANCSQCAAVISKSLLSQGGAQQEKHLANAQRRDATRDQALLAMQASAAQFLAMMGDVSDDDEDEDDDNAGQMEEVDEEEGESDRSRVACSIDSDTADCAAEGKQTAPQASSGEDVPLCIICQTGNDPMEPFNCLAYLAMTQSSTVFAPRPHPSPNSVSDGDVIHLAPVHPRLEVPDSTPLHAPFSCHMHVAFCGHAMHVSCFGTYYESVVRRSQEHRNLILDTSKKQFQCPLCKKLNNLLVPHVDVDLSAAMTVDEGPGLSDEWLQWIESPSVLVASAATQLRRKQKLDRTRCEVIERQEEEEEEDGNELEDLNSSSSHKRHKRSESDQHDASTDESDLNIMLQPSFYETDAANALLRRLISTNRSQSLVNDLTTSMSGRVDSSLAKTLQRSFWFRFLKDFSGSVYADTSAVPTSSLVLSDYTRRDHQLLRNFTMLLQTVSSGIAYSLCSDFLSASSISSGEDSAPSQKGFDSLKFISNTVDAMAASLVRNEYLLAIHSAVMKSFQGAAQNISGTIFESNSPGCWLSASVHEVSCVSLLSCPLMDILVLLVAMAKGKALLRRQSLESKFSTSNRAFFGVSKGDEDMSVDAMQLLSGFGWICVAKLTQMCVSLDVVIDHKTTEDFPSVINLVSGILLSVSRLRAEGVKRDESTTGLRSLLAEWTTFVVTARHVMQRICPELEGAWGLFGGGDRSSSNIKVDGVTDKTVCEMLRSVGLADLCISQASHETVIVTVNLWVADMPAGSTNSTSLKTSGASDEMVVAASEEKEEEEMGEEDVIAAVSNLLTSEPPPMSRGPVCSAFGHHLSYLHYPHAVLPSLIALPDDYSRLHARISAMCPNVEFPVLCLVCGAVLDAGGKGQCCAHTVICGGESSIFFQLQDCSIMISHGPRCAILPAPYVDMYGENQHSYRGKPLRLDRKRYDTLSRLWASHGLVREVAAKRSNSSSVIINGYY